MDNKCKIDPCGCQRYRAIIEETNNEDECRCGHRIGFHESLIIDPSEHPYGPCKISSGCNCQMFKGKPSDNERCIYCNHDDIFHSSWETTSLNNKNSQSSPTISITADAIPPTENLNRTAGRPPTKVWKINHVICFNKISSNKIPKEGTDLWCKLESKNLIKKDIEISQTTPDELYDFIYNLFNEELNDQGWILYSGSSGSPRPINDKLSFDLIKSHTTKAKRKLYIGPDKYDIDLSSASLDTYDIDLTNNELNLHDPNLWRGFPMDTFMDWIESMPQSDPTIDYTNHIQYSTTTYYNN